MSNLEETLEAEKGENQGIAKKEAIAYIKNFPWYNFVFLAIALICILARDGNYEFQFSIIQETDYIKITKNTDAFISPLIFLAGTIGTIFLRKFVRKRKGLKKVKEDQDQKMDRVTDGCVFYFFMIPIILIAIFWPLNNLAYRIEFDKDKGISHTKYFIGSNYNFTKDDIKRAYIGNIRGRGYSVWDLHLELKNEDIVHPETSIKGEKLLKEHIKEVWHINIYNEYKNEWEYWDEEAVE